MSESLVSISTIIIIIEIFVGVYLHYELYWLTDNDKCGKNIIISEFLKLCWASIMLFIIVFSNVKKYFMTTIINIFLSMIGFIYIFRDCFVELENAGNYVSVLGRLFGIDMGLIFGQAICGLIMYLDGVSSFDNSDTN